MIRGALRAVPALAALKQVAVIEPMLWFTLVEGPYT